MGPILDSNVSGRITLLNSSSIRYEVNAWQYIQISFMVGAISYTGNISWCFIHVAHYWSR